MLLIYSTEGSGPEGGTPEFQNMMNGYFRFNEYRPTPVVRLNRAVATAMARTPEDGLAMMAPLADDLDGYHHFHSARADLLRRSGRPVEAADAYAEALTRVGNDAERAFLEGRLAEVRADTESDDGAAP